MQNLGGKTAVVTGGGGGIGRALGERFLAEGMRVALADIDAPLLAATVAELRERHGDAVIGVPTDVSLLESVEALRDAAVAAFGAVHLVCNNAGIPSGSDGALWEHHVNDWRWALDVNVLGVVHGINAFVPMLLAQGEGHVVNTSSSNGTFAPLSNSAVYATTKANNSLDIGVYNTPAEVPMKPDGTPYYTQATPKSATDAGQLTTLAIQVGLDGKAFEECLASGRHAARVAEDLAEVAAAGGRGTPHSILITPDGQIPIEGAQPYANIKALIDAQLAK